MAAGSAHKVSPEPTPPRHVRGSRVAGWIIGTLAGAGRRRIHRFVFFGSDSSDASRKCDESEAGGLSHLGSVTRIFSCSACTLILNGLVVKQDAHPTPPVADLPKMEFNIQWREVLTGHVVGQVLLTHPHVHINLIQLRSEKASQVPLSKKGWQDAIEAFTPSR